MTDEYGREVIRRGISTSSARPNSPPKHITYSALLHALKEDINWLEKKIEADTTITERLHKRLDKAVTVMKVGLKTMKRALKDKKR